MELFRLLGTIAIENDAAIKGIKETTGEAEKSESKMSKTFGKIGAVAKKVAIASAAAVGTATVAITKKAVTAYADYEQLVGGVETLFKDSSGKLMEYANNAFMTAGLSANEYMETATSFSASLLQSLGGDTEKAADYADRAITDMSDNANKMGTSMEMIQNAYQGFAKQNYTMLDNLKLGYGGTKEEMERLLADAQAISGVEYDISSYADVVDAIHVIQTEMGITGTTAEEASQTISGSISAAKGAWQNFLVGMTDGSQNMDVLVENLASSVVTVGKNLIPRIATTLKSIGTLIINYVPKIIAGLRKKSPEFLQTGLDFIIKIAKGLVDALPKLIEKIPVIINNMANATKENSSKLSQAGWELIKTLGLGLIKAIPTLIKNIPQIIKAIVNALTSFAWGSVGKGLIDLIANGIKKAASKVKESAENVKDKLLKPFIAAKEKIEEIIDKIKGFFPLKIGKIFSNLKLPKIDIDGGKAPFGIGGKGKLPSFDVKWNAMGAVFKKPTIFSTTQGLQGVGEAGAEAVAPIDTLQQYVAGAVASQNEGIIYALQNILSAIQSLDGNMGDSMRYALNGTAFELNRREFGRLVKEVR